MIATSVAIGAGFKLELFQLNNQSKSFERYREVKKQLFYNVKFTVGCCYL